MYLDSDLAKQGTDKCLRNMEEQQQWETEQLERARKARTKETETKKEDSDDMENFFSQVETAVKKIKASPATATTPPNAEDALSLCQQYHVRVDIGALYSTGLYMKFA